MEAIAKLLGGTIVLILILFIGSIIGACFGALGGWLVSFVFNENILRVLAAFGIKGIAVWELGCFLGFVCVFFRSTTSKD